MKKIMFVLAIVLVLQGCGSNPQVNIPTDSKARNHQYLVALGYMYNLPTKKFKQGDGSEYTFTGYNIDTFGEMCEDDASKYSACAQYFLPQMKFIQEVRAGISKLYGIPFSEKYYPNIIDAAKPVDKQKITKNILNFQDAEVVLNKLYKKHGV